MITTILLSLLLQTAGSPDLVLGVQPRRAANQTLFRDFLSEFLFATGFDKSVDASTLTHDVAILKSGDNIVANELNTAAAADTEGHVIFGKATPEWLKNPNIEEITFEADIRSTAVLTMRTRVKTAATAEVMADNLRGYLISFRTNDAAPASVLESVRAARVTTVGNTIQLSMTFTPEAMQRLRHNEASSAILTWHLGTEDRDRWQRVADIAKQLSIKPGSRVADIGSGDGYLSVRLARIVGSGGSVLAVDIDRKILNELQWRAREAGLNQIAAVAGDADDPKLPRDSLDAAVIVNAYHEMPEHQQMLAHIFNALKPGGRIVLVEPFSEAMRLEPRTNQEKQHKIAPEFVVEDLRQAGFKLVTRDDNFINEGQLRQGLVVAQRPE